MQREMYISIYIYVYHGVIDTNTPTPTAYLEYYTIAISAAYMSTPHHDSPP